jgi:cell pole-organizing protein PopZ
MSGNTQQQGGKAEDDMSMEDILHSIRRIIADEDSPPAPAATNGEAMAASDVLELTDMMPEEEKPVAAPEPAAAPDDVLAKIDTMLTPTAPAAPEEAPVAAKAPAQPQPAKVAAMPAPQPDADEFLSATTTQAVSQAINKLDEVLEPQMPQIPSPAFASGNTVEKMVMDMLRPMMKSWLDANLPVIVERIVEREVRKLIR